MARLTFRRPAVDRSPAAIMPVEGWALLTYDEQSLLLLVGDYMNGRHTFAEFESRLTEWRQCNDLGHRLRSYLR